MIYRRQENGVCGLLDCEWCCADSPTKVQPGVLAQYA